MYGNESKDRENCQDFMVVFYNVIAYCYNIYVYFYLYEGDMIVKR